MSWVKQRYQDISPVSLQVEGGQVSSSLYCGEVEGVGGLVEAFLVELYRCKLCQFTCGLKGVISSHLQLKHRPPTLTYLGDAEEGGGAEGGGAYQLDLNVESKQSEDEDEDFLLYNMLDNMSPPTCDISSEGGLQVSTLFEEDSSIFPMKGASVSLSCPIEPPSTQEEMAQSAHLMTLGLCRISAKPPPAAPRPPLTPPDAPPRCRRQKDSRVTLTPRRLPCPMCPLRLPSKTLLDVHLRSHVEGGGFRCVTCSWTTDSWEELEPHWRSSCGRRRRRRRRRERQKQEEKKKKKKKKKMRSSASPNNSERWTVRLIGRAEGQEAEHTDSATEKKEKSRTNREVEESRLCCSLCHRKFSSQLTLTRHLGVHRGDKPHICPQCPYSSRLKASLLQHLRTHTGEKPHRCTECPYASIDRSSLLRHRRTHSQEKPYRCQHCDYSSIQKKSLDLHARRHHTGEVFSCQQCEYSSADRQLLLRHVRRHHPPHDVTG